jgi:hypothetical protein
MKINHWTKTIGVLLLSLGLFKPASGFAQMLSIQSGSSIDVTRPAQPDSLVQVAAESQGLAQIAPEDLPIIGGTFWWVMPGGNAVPAPCAPLDLSGAIYQIADGQFLVDETGGQVVVNTHRFGLQAQATSSTVASEVASQADAVINLITRVQTATANQQMQAMGMDVPFPGDGGSGNGGTNAYTSNYSSYTVDYGTNVWIAQVAIISSNLLGIVTNSSPAISYEIQSRTNLIQNDWGSEGFIIGSKTTNWTPISVAKSNRPNLFLRVKSWADTQGVGIPDWWQLFYFHQVGIDPNADPDGDGLSNIQEYLQGTDPTVFDVPSALTGFIAILSTNGTDVALSWDPSVGAVQHYTIGRYDWNWDTWQYDFTSVGQVNGNVTSFIDVGAISGGDYWDSYYEIQAVYATGSTPATSSWIYLSPPSPPAPTYDIPITAYLVRNQTGRWQVMFSGLPIGAQTIQLTWTDSNWNITTQNILTTILTNGIYQIPDTDAVNFMGASLAVQLYGPNGEPGQLVQAGTLANDAPYFVDGRQHSKQNLNFLIRSASLHRPFGAFIDGRLNQAATNFEEFSFLHHDSDYYGNTWAELDNLWPFTENYNFRNYLVDTTRTDTPYGGTNFNFQINFANNIPAPTILSADPYGTLQPGFLPVQDFYRVYFVQAINTNGLEWGVTLQNTQSVASLQSGLNNVFGLPYQSGIEIDYNSAPGFGPNTWLCPGFPIYYQSLLAGGSVTAHAPSFLVGAYASQCPAPTLQLANYYFAPLLNPNANPMSLPLLGQQPFPLPVDDTFNVTNQTPTAILGSVGQPMILGGWAKYSIKNGSVATGKYAYLGQYFMTNAFLLDTNGNMTTNSAGIVSPYGEFFPTQAGRAALVTMPDIDPPYQQGTCTVQVVKLQLDANHDGSMDLSFNGKDTTSASQPYVFWINNNYDRGHTVDFTDFEQDDLEMDDSPGTPNQNTSDCNYLDIGENRIIPCTRDLEDYARLWVYGVTSNLLTSLPTNSTVTLSWGDVGNPNPNNPTIDLFTAADTGGGIGYLTNETIAVHQIDPTYSPYIHRLGPGQSIQLNANYFGNTWRGNYFIWCGVKTGNGSLTLTFMDGNNHILGQSSVYIQLKDIKQMYERWTVGDNPGRAPDDTASLAWNDLPPGVSQPFQYTASLSNTPFILFVHGWNLPMWGKDRFAETAFKRLYWQGYQGRFGLFRWPTLYAFPLGEMSLQAVNVDSFDTSEFASWRAGAPLRKLLVQLNNEYPGQVRVCSHSHGNIAVGEALRTNVTLVHTYVAMQAAVPSHAYDVLTPIRSIPLALDDGTIERYAAYWTNIAPCYFNSSAGASHFVNFFNFNDWALGWWTTDQNTKPDIGYSWAPAQNGLELYYYSTSPYSSRELYFPTNTFEIFSYIIEGRCYAVGQQVNVGGVFDTNKQVNLANAPYDFGNTHKDHSGEFRSDNADRAPFWNKVLQEMGLKQ